MYAHNSVKIQNATLQQTNFDSGKNRQKNTEHHVHLRLCNVTFWFCFCFCNFLRNYNCMSLYWGFFHIHPLSLCFSFILYGLLNSVLQYSLLICVCSYFNLSLLQTCIIEIVNTCIVNMLGNSMA